MIFDTLPFEKPSHQKMALIHGFTVYMYVLPQGFQAVEINTPQPESTINLTQLKGIAQSLLQHENIMQPWIQQDESHLNLLFQAPASFNFALKLMDVLADIPNGPHDNYSAKVLALAFENANQQSMTAMIGDRIWIILGYLEEGQHLEQLTTDMIQKFIHDLATKSRTADWHMQPRIRFERQRLRSILQDELERREPSSQK